MGPFLLYFYRDIANENHLNDFACVRNVVTCLQQPFRPSEWSSNFENNPHRPSEWSSNFENNPCRPSEWSSNFENNPRRPSERSFNFENTLADPPNGHLILKTPPCKSAWIAVQKRRCWSAKWCRLRGKWHAFVRKGAVHGI